VLNSFAGTATKQARRGYKEARANVDSVVDDMSERGSAMMDAAQDAAFRSRNRWKMSLRSARLQPLDRARPCFLIGATWRG